MRIQVSDSLPTLDLNEVEGAEVMVVTVRRAPCGHDYSVQWIGAVGAVLRSDSFVVVTKGLAVEGDVKG